MAGFFESDAGNKSMIRLLSFMGFWLGAAIALGGMVALFMKLGAAGTAIITGGGLAGGGEAVKALQKKFESK